MLLAAELHKKEMEASIEKDLVVKRALEKQCKETAERLAQIESSISRKKHMVKQYD